MDDNMKLKDQDEIPDQLQDGLAFGILQSTFLGGERN